VGGSIGTRRLDEEVLEKFNIADITEAELVLQSLGKSAQMKAENNPLRI
jgi:hypothetical protein